MKLAVSNIAWPADRRDEAYAILRAAGITGLEVAPGLLMAQAAVPLDPTPAELDAVRRELDAAGLELVSMQSLLFGASDIALFGTAGQRENLCAAMGRAIALAGRLGIGNLVFGSPRQRAYPPEMSAAEAEAIAADTFRRLGDLALAAGARIAIEPNGKAYGTNFLNRIEEAETFVRRVGHPGVALNFDIGALHMEGDFDRIEAIAAHAADCFVHVHVSEPHLGPAPARSTDAARAFAAIEATGYSGWYSIEMAATAQPLADVEAAVGRLVEAVALHARGQPR